MIVLIAATILAASNGLPLDTYSPGGPEIQVTLTNGASFVIVTDPDGSPKTTAGVLHLVRSHFYDGQRMHRVENWVVQWGDPQSKKLPIDDPRVGSQGSGMQMPFEPHNLHFERTIVGVASNRARTGSNGQIFVLRKDAPILGHNYSVLGKVISGMNVVDRIKKGDRILRMVVLQ